MPVPPTRDAYFEQVARLTKALSSPRRLALLELLVQGERTVENLANAAGLSVANTSRHLQVLRQAGLVAVERQGLYGYYRTAGEDVEDFLLRLRDLSEELLFEVLPLGDAIRTSVEDQQPPLEDLFSLICSGQALLIDARPSEEFVSCHLPGAISVPPEEAAAMVTGLPDDRAVVVYGRGPYCDIAPALFALLSERGLETIRLLEGVGEWKAAGYPVTSGA